MHAFIRFSSYCFVLLFSLVALVSASTTDSTYLVKDIDAGAIPNRSLCSQPIRVGDVAYFCGERQHLWRTDGTEEGTFAVTDSDGQLITRPEPLIAVNGLLYFLANEEPSRYSSFLWVTDGTRAGTQIVTFKGGPRAPYPKHFTAFKDQLFFFVSSNLWTAEDGIARKVASTTPGQPPNDVVVVNDLLYFTNREDELWKSDGTASGTERLVDFPGVIYQTVLANLTDVNGVLYFTLRNDKENVSLWKSDGTASGTERLMDLPDAANLRVVANLTEVDGVLYFSLWNGKDNLGLWKSDGTAAGTVLVKEIPVARIRGFANVDGTLFFFTNVSNIWISDGTTLGTRLVTTLPDGIEVGRGVSVNNRFVFSAGNRNMAGLWAMTGLWASDGTERGTVELKKGQSFGSFTEHNGTLYFSFDDGMGLGTELWKTDGTVAGTQIVRDIAWGPKSSSPSFFSSIASGLIFQANKGNHLGGDALWISDGTKRGTQQVKDISQFTKDADPRQLTRVADEIYFLVNKTRRPRRYQQWELWKSDGSQAGTRQVVNLVEDVLKTSAELGGEYGELIAFDGRLFFTGNDGSGWALWQTDPDIDGAMVIDALPGPTVGRIYNLTRFGGNLYFFANVGNDAGLWRLGPGELSATLIQGGLISPNKLKVLNDRLVFVNNFAELWYATGRVADANLIASIERGRGGNVIEDFLAVNDRLFALRVLPSALDQEREDRSELWVSNGTETGTLELTRPYPQESNLLVSNDRLWFGDSDGILVYDESTRQPVRLTDETVRYLTDVDDGFVYFYKPEQYQLWKSDGTVTGTVPIVNDVDVTYMAGIDQQVYFSAYDILSNGDVDADSLSLRKLTGGAGDAVVVEPDLELIDLLGRNAFFGRKGRSGDEFPIQIWRTDGTEAGTERLSNFDRLNFNSSRSTLGASFTQLLVDDLLYVTLDANNLGSEIWAVDLASDSSIR